MTAFLAGVRLGSAIAEIVVDITAQVYVAWIIR